MEAMTTLWAAMYEDDELARAAAATDKLLRENPDLTIAITDAATVMRNVAILIPVAPDPVESRKLLPIFEADRELQSSTTLVRLGFYKQALAALRNVLELGLLSVYSAADDEAREKFGLWLAGERRTPDVKQMTPSLKKIPAVTEHLKTDPEQIGRASCRERV